MSSSVLIIEEFADLRAMLASALTSAQYTCDQARSGADAVAMLRTHQYSTILLSPRLPIASDPVMQYLHAEQPAELVNVVLMTEPEQENDECRSIMKPFNKEQLMATMIAK